MRDVKSCGDFSLLPANFVSVGKLAGAVFNCTGTEPPRFFEAKNLVSVVPHFDVGQVSNRLSCGKHGPNRSETCSTWDESAK